MHRFGKWGLFGFSLGCISTTDKQGYYISKYPTYTLNELSQNSMNSDRILVSYRDGVYDITDFKGKHPGGPKYFEMVNGGRLESFWSQYTDHMFDRDTLQILESYRIGNLHPNDVINDTSKTIQYKEYDVWENEPKRDDQMRIMHLKPFLGEPHLELLGQQYYTPNELFYVRNHFPVPDMTKDDYKLHLCLSNDKTAATFDDVNDNWDIFDGDCVYSFNELIDGNKFKQIEIDATLQCSGNRGGEMRDIIGSKGSDCMQGFISNAKWKGVSLLDLLYKSGYETGKYSKYKYITFYGSDTDFSGIHYATSIPISHVLNEDNDVILAYQMNNEPLPPDHGYPMRCVYIYKNISFLIY